MQLRYLCSYATWVVTPLGIRHNWQFPSPGLLGAPRNCQNYPCRSRWDILLSFLTHKNNCVEIYRTHREIFSKSYWVKLKSYCIYYFHFAINLNQTDVHLVWIWFRPFKFFSEDYSLPELHKIKKRNSQKSVHVFLNVEFMYCVVVSWINIF